MCVGVKDIFLFCFCKNTTRTSTVSTVSTESSELQQPTDRKKKIGRETKRGEVANKRGEKKKREISWRTIFGLCVRLFSCVQKAQKLAAVCGQSYGILFRCSMGNGVPSLFPSPPPPLSRYTCRMCDGCSRAPLQTARSLSCFLASFLLIVHFFVRVVTVVVAVVVVCVLRHDFMGSGVCHNVRRWTIWFCFATNFGRDHNATAK